MRTPPTIDENHAKRVQYEFRMFRFLGVHLYDLNELAMGTGRGVEKAELIKDAALESFLLHTRVLLDFFFPANPKDADLIAKDFISNWDQLDDKPKLKYFKEEKRKGASRGVRVEEDYQDQRFCLDKNLAHLTIDRVELKKRNQQWEIHSIKEDILPQIQFFHGNLPPNIKPWFASDG